MLESLCDSADTPAIPLVPLRREELEGYVASLPERDRAWVESNAFRAAPNSHLILPGPEGKPASVLVGYDPGEAPWSFADLSARLPGGTYRFKAMLDPWTASQAALGWALAQYRFDRYRRKDETPEKPRARLVWPHGVERAEVARLVTATGMVRDLVNTPAEDLGPSDLIAQAQEIGTAYGAKMESWSGERLLQAGYPLVHAVGRAASRPPAVMTLTWGESGPHVALVGKGVIFDSGGLDLKGADGMKIMKKDMGGAAQALALARLIMDADLPVRLTLVLPAAENAVAGNAFRPLDVFTSRKGLTVEIGNTDAEGRLLLADALARASEAKPDLILDFATLTGAARVALGPEVPALFSNDDTLGQAWQAAGQRVNDPVWRLPLQKSYRRLLESSVADLSSTGESRFGGAITAALFLEQFVPEETPWAHLDLMAWNPVARPGRPFGGEAQGLRAAYAMLDEWAASGGQLPS